MLSLLEGNDAAVAAKFAQVLKNSKFREQVLTGQGRRHLLSD